MILVTPFFAAVMGIIFVGLSFNVVRYRAGKKVSLGSGGDKDLEHAIRAQANFIEYVPLALILMWILESLTLSGRLTFWLGVALLLSRVAHALGMLFPKDLFVLRQLGMFVTFVVLLTACLMILQYYLPVSI